MKTVVAIALLGSSSALAAVVQSPLDCFRAAASPLSRFLVTESQQAQLCAGAVSDAPIRCFLTAKGAFALHYSLSNDEIVRVCAGAVVPEMPLRCVLAASSLLRAEGLTSTQLAQLCVGAQAETAAAGCYRNADHLGLMQEDRLVLCAGAR